MWNLYSQVFFCPGPSHQQRVSAGRRESGTDPGTNCLVAFKENHTAALVTRCEIVARVVELDGGDDIGWGSLQSAQPSQRSAQATTLYWMAGKYSGSGVLLPYLL